MDDYSKQYVYYSMLMSDDQGRTPTEEEFQSTDTCLQIIAETGNKVFRHLHVTVVTRRE